MTLKTMNNYFCW